MVWITFSFRGKDLAEFDQQPASSGELAVCLIGKSSLRLWSHSTAERLVMQFGRAGLRKNISEDELANHDDALVLVRADAVLDQQLHGVQDGPIGLDGVDLLTFEGEDLADLHDAPPG